MDVSSYRRITRLRNGELGEVEDEIVNEFVLRLAIAGETVATLLCSPGHLEDLAAGYLLTSGIVWPENPLSGLKFDAGTNTMHAELANQAAKDRLDLGPGSAEGGQGSRVAACRPAAGRLETGRFDPGKGICALKTAGVRISRISKERIGKLMAEFSASSDLFRRTGAVHSIAVADGERVLVRRDDIGRHNAFDKAVGSIYLSGRNLSDKIILASCRISSEIMVKTIRAGAPVIISRSAPTAAALDLAEEYRVTTVGFARAGNFNLYTHPERVIL